MADAWEQIKAAMLHQVAPIENPSMGMPPPEPLYHGNPEILPLTDRGFVGHAADNVGESARRDDGSPLAVPTIVDMSAGCC